MKRNIVKFHIPFNVSIYPKGNPALKQYLLKGKQIAVDGALKQDRWQKDGQNFSKVYIVANTVQLLGGKSDGEQTHTSSAPKSAHNTNQSDDGGFPEDNSDIPF